MPLPRWRQNGITPVDQTLMNMLGFAVSSGSPPPTTFTAADETQLNDALTAVNAGQTATTYSITLTAPITLNAALVAIGLPADDALVIDGNGQTIDGGGAFAASA